MDDDYIKAVGFGLRELRNTLGVVEFTGTTTDEWRQLWAATLQRYINGEPLEAVYPVFQGLANVAYLPHQDETVASIGRIRVAEDECLLPHGILEDLYRIGQPLAVRDEQKGWATMEREFVTGAQALEMRLNAVLKTAENGHDPMTRQDIAAKVEEVLRRHGYQARVMA